MRETQLPAPDTVRTPQLLLPLALDSTTPLPIELAGYRALYGLDRLNALYDQGYLAAAEHRVHVQVFRPQSVCVGTVFLIHGYLEHSAIYQPMINELLLEQFAVVTFDLPGHGLSSGAAASIREFAVYQQVLNDLWAWSASQPAEKLPKPWLGIGQSTGGAIWLDHILRRSGRRQPLMIDRALLLSPLVRPNKTSWWHNPLGLSIISRLTREVPRAFRRNNHNPDFLRFVRKFDPLQPRTMGMEWIMALSRWMKWIEEQPRCRVPVWVAQGARDQTVDWRYNVEFIRRKCRLQTLLMLEEGSHQLINERPDIRLALTALIPAFLHADQVR
ncbi:MAG: alpha/beta hydrolase [Pseudomonadota bacterium]|nr:alpha/beta hydrolase [Pseudomonadota bacterium]